MEGDVRESEEEEVKEEDEFMGQVHVAQDTFISRSKRFTKAPAVGT
jgi:hypothetical protein